MSGADHVVVVLDPHGRRRPYGRELVARAAHDLARRLRAWGLNARALRGRIEGGKFIAAEETPPVWRPAA